MVDYAVNKRDIDGDQFLHMFIVSGTARQFERGNPRYVAGKSGVEIANEILPATNEKGPCGNSDYSSGKTPEYWAGWALAQYQWQTAKSFKSILRDLPFSSIVGFYPTLHEADITKFYSVAEQFVSGRNSHTNLKRIRTAAQITQDKLALESGVSLRSIQMYEQRNKDINKAQAISLARISRVLGCDVEDLLENEPVGDSNN